MYKNILVAIDVDERASWESSIPIAMSLAQCFSAHVTLCSVLRDAEAASAAQWSAIAYREMLETMRARLRLVGSEACGGEFAVEIGMGTILEGILQAARTSSADLIVISSHRPGIKDHFISANAARVARRAPCSVLIVRDEMATLQDGLERSL